MELFRRRVFDPPEHTCPQVLQEKSKHIIEKCNGLPLAIVSIAGVLSSKQKKTEEEWGKVLDCLGSGLDYYPNLQGMKKILNLSFMDLPYPIKRCFLYLIKYPEDYLINRKLVQRLWVAEGLVGARGNMSAEDVAEFYFNELVNRYMILPSEMSSISGKVRNFRVHDIMLEVIVSESTEEGFMSVVGGDEKESRMAEDVVNIRRLSMHGGSRYSFRNSIITKEKSLCQVRSLSVFYGYSLDPVLLEASWPRMLRVLDLEWHSNIGNDHLKAIMKLLHLKYLSLKGTNVTELPETLGNLRYLETLDYTWTDIKKVPQSIIKLGNLRCLKGHRHLQVPRGIGRLRFLQYLALQLRGGSKNDVAVTKELGELTQLRKLKITLVRGWGTQVGEDLCKSLEAISSSLRSLSLAVDPDAGTLEFLNDVSFASPRLLLESLALGGSLEALPGWVCKLTHLFKLDLWDNRLQGNDWIAILAALPNLIKLKVYHDAYVGDCLHFNTPSTSTISSASNSSLFPQLRELHLGYLEIASLSFGGGAGTDQSLMPNLQLLSLTGLGNKETNKLSIAGIKHLPNLKTIRSTGCQYLQLDEIKEQVQEHPNSPKLELLNNTQLQGLTTMPNC